MDDKKDRESLFQRHRENIYFRWGLTAFIVIAACVVLAQFVNKLPAVFSALGALLRTLAPVFYGLGIAYLLDPIVERLQLVLRPRLQSRMKRPQRAESLSRGLGVFVSLVVLLLVVWALLAMVLPQLVDSLTTIIRSLPDYYNTIQGWLTDLIGDNLTAADVTNTMMDTVYGYFENWLTTSLLPRVTSMLDDVTTSAVGIVRALVNLVIGLIISVYLLMSKDTFLGQAKKLCYAILGQRAGGYFCNICTYANRTFGGFIGGKIVDSLIIGVLCFIGLSILKIPYTMLISIIVCVTNVIPVFGPYLGAVPSAALLLVIDPIYCLTFIIFIIILQQIDGNIIGPMILGDAIGVGGFWVMVSILVFGSLYGVLGMVIGVPLFAVIYKLLTEVTNWALRRRGLSTASKDYQAWNYPPRPDPDNWLRPRSSRRRKLRFWVHGRRAARKGAPETPPEEPPEEPDDPPQTPAP